MNHPWFEHQSTRMSHESFCTSIHGRSRSMLICAISLAAKTKTETEQIVYRSMCRYHFLLLHHMLALSPLA